MFKFAKKEKVEQVDVKFTKNGVAKQTTIEEELTHVSELAGACLNSDAFKKYKEGYKVIEARIIEDIIQEAKEFEYNDKSLATFGAIILSKLIKLISIKSLLMSVTKDVSRGVAVSDEKDDK